jgi:excinuclease UvrABC helicase subunit UvrB
MARDEITSGEALATGATILGGLLVAAAVANAVDDEPEEVKAERRRIRAERRARAAEQREREANRRILEGRGREVVIEVERRGGIFDDIFSAPTYSQRTRRSEIEDQITELKMELIDADADNEWDKARRLRAKIRVLEQRLR